jgi:hypothetical protein
MMKCFEVLLSISTCGATAWEYKENFRQFRNMMYKNQEMNIRQTGEDYKAGAYICPLLIST